MPMTVRSLYRYPVKGLSAEALPHAILRVAECLPHDRRFAIARASAHIDPEKPEWLPKTNFFMLMRDERLAQLQTKFDEGSGNFSIERTGRLLLNARITDPIGRQSIDAFLAEFLKDLPDGPPRLVEAPGHTFSDARQKPDATTYKYVSLVNLASISDLERVAHVSVDPVRFRANVYFEGAAAWNELQWIGDEVRIGTARLRIVSPITRCPATAVNPVTAERDLDIPRILAKEFGHNCMGIYGEVVEGGKVESSDSMVRLHRHTGAPRQSD